MSIQMVLAPLFVQVILTFVIVFILAGHRTSLLRSGKVRPADVALGQPNWPDLPTKAANSLRNQLEFPVLFYVLTILSIITRHADLLFVFLAWVFVLSRIFHAYVHMTFNRLQVRGPAFGVGALVLAIMWVIFIVRIMLELP